MYLRTAVNTNKFTVDEATGNTTIAGTLDILGTLLEQVLRLE